MGTIAQLVEDESVGLIVVGRPVSLAGNETESTRQADELCRKIRDRIHHAPSCSSTSASRPSKRSVHWRGGHEGEESTSHVDSAAAVIMLQHYLDGLFC